MGGPAATKKKKKRGLCESCGNGFEQVVGKGRPRRYCLDCSPARWPEKPSVEVMPDLPGAPFTIEHFRAWVERLTLADGERFELEPFQADYVDDVFRGIRECWLIVPEGNGKTTLIALVALYHLEFTVEGYVTVAAARNGAASTWAGSGTPPRSSRCGPATQSFGCSAPRRF